MIEDTVAVAIFIQCAGTIEVEAINKVGSLFYGTIMATFALAILTRSANTVGVNVGIVAGVLVNLILWLLARDKVFWFWCNATGAATTTSVAIIVSRLSGEASRLHPPSLGKVQMQARSTLVLVGHFVAFVALSLSLVLLV